IVDGLSFCHQAPPVPLTSDERTYLLSTVVTIQSLAPGAASPCHSFREATTQPVNKPPYAFNAMCCHNWDAALSPHTARSALSLTHPWRNWWEGFRETYDEIETQAMGPTESTRQRDAEKNRWSRSSISSHRKSMGPEHLQPPCKCPAYVVRPSTLNLAQSQS
ncbi:hypothetical protein RB213_014954, partial [Colletotrichum asianum]